MKTSMNFRLKTPMPQNMVITTRTVICSCPADGLSLSPGDTAVGI